MNQSSVKDSKVKVKNQTLAKNYSSIHNLKKKSENEWKELVPPKKDIHEIKEMVNTIDKVEENRITWLEFATWMIKEGKVRNIAND